MDIGGLLLSDPTSGRVILSPFLLVVGTCASSSSCAWCECVASPEVLLRRSMAAALASMLRERGARLRKVESEFDDAVEAKARRKEEGLAVASGRKGAQGDGGPNGASSVGDVRERSGGDQGSQAQATLRLQQLSELEATVDEREAVVDEIADSVNELAALFRDLADLVHEQGTIMNHIGESMHTAAKNTERGNEELVQGNRLAEKATKKTLCILLLSLGLAFTATVLS